MNGFKVHERDKAYILFRETFGFHIKYFYDGFSTYISQKICIDIYKFDDCMHELYGNYEDDGKSLENIVVEKYGEKALEVLKIFI